jgi:hypothetical protein
MNPAREERLREGGADLSESTVPTLEDLFLDLTTDKDTFSPLPEKKETN